MKIQRANFCWGFYLILIFFLYHDIALYAPFKATKYIFEYNYDDVALWGLEKNDLKNINMMYR